MADRAFSLHEALTTKPCIGCATIKPGLHFMVRSGEGLGSRWEEVDVCDDCAGKLTAEDVYRLVTLEDDEPERAEAAT